MKLALIPAIVYALCCCAPAHAAEHPNIVFLFADDMGWGDVHCYGHPYAKTPHIDQLAGQGTRFRQCYATGVTCCPSRTGFMTSKHPATYAKYPANGGFGNRVTITELLKKQGYATGHFGKWHIGPVQESGTYGIDVVGAEESAAEKRKRRDNSGRDAPIYDQAIDFIEKHKDGPFYVNVWGHIPHHPVNPSDAIKDAFGDLTIDESKFPPEMREKLALCKKLGGDVSEHMRTYLSEIAALDRDVGRLLKRLDELGLRENTLVVFSSDQGPAPLRGADDGRVKKAIKKSKAKGDDVSDDVIDVRRNAMGFAGPFRGGKHNQYEGGVRIPFIVRWPGHVTAGRVDEKSVISGMDWLPTLCAITGIAINATDFDGDDVSAAYLGKDVIRTKPLFWKTSAPQTPGTIRDGQWKLHHPNGNRGELELYDIAADPGEHQNLVAKHPEVVQRLSAKLDAWQATLPKTYDKTDDGDK